MTKAEKDAFKQQWANTNMQPSTIYPVPTQFTQRQQIAIAAMQGILTAHDPEKDINYNEVAQDSLLMSGAMMRLFGIKDEPKPYGYPMTKDGFLPGTD